MDPMQMQNPQGQMPINPAVQGQIPPQGYVMPGQAYPQQPMVQPIQQPMSGYVQQPVVAPQQAAAPSEGIFDKILKGIIGFIAKASGQPDPVTGTGGTLPQQPMQQPMAGYPQQPVAPQQAPMGGFLGQIGSTLGNIANQAESGLGAVATGLVGDTSVPAPATSTQDILTQNYQQTTQPQYYQQPVQQYQQPVAQPVMQQAVYQQPVAQPVMSTVDTQPIYQQPVVQPVVQQPMPTVEVQQAPSQQPISQL